MTAPLPPPNNSRRNRLLLYVTGILLILIFLFFLLWLLYFRFHETTDDAYVNGSLVNVTSVVEGTPIAFFADDTDLVEQGQLLILLDPTPFQVDYEKELAMLANISRQVKQLYDQVRITQANVQDAEVNLANTRFDYENRENLVGISAVSEEDFVHSKNTFHISEINLARAKANLEYAQAAAGNTPMELHPLIENQRNIVLKAYYKLYHCAIYAPVRGHIAQRSVEVGQWALIGRPLMAIVPQEGMWVDANFKETQLKWMRVGQPVSVTIDLYGNHPLKGKVLGISSGSGSVFSVIPPQNATGNWIKIVQRLAVRIGLDPEELKDYPLRLGLSAYTNVDISNTDLPMLVEKIKQKPIVTTPIFEIDFVEVNQLMENIISENLNASIL